MEVKHGENTGSDRQITILATLEDPEALYKLIQTGIISSATETWSISGYSAQYHAVAHDEGRPSSSRNCVGV